MTLKGEMYPTKGVSYFFSKGIPLHLVLNYFFHGIYTGKK